MTVRQQQRKGGGKERQNGVNEEDNEGQRTHDESEGIERHNLEGEVVVVSR